MKDAVIIGLVIFILADVVAGAADSLARRDAATNGYFEFAGTVYRVTKMEIAK